MTEYNIFLKIASKIIANVLRLENGTRYSITKYN